MTEVTAWSQTDASNNSASPAGAPENMAPSGLNDTMRAMQGGVARRYARDGQPTTTAGTATAYTLTYSPALAAYVNGETFLVEFNSTCGASPTININGLGALPVHKFNASAGTWGALAAGDFVSGTIARLAYNSGAGAMRIISAPSLVGGLAGTGSVLTSTDASATVGPALELFRDSVSPAALDMAGEILFTVRDSAAAKITGAEIIAEIISPTAGSVTTSIPIWARTTGSYQKEMEIGNGVEIGAPPGGDKGFGSANASRYYSDGAGMWQTLDSSSVAAAASYIKDSIPSWVNFLRIRLDLFPVSDGVELQLLARKASGTDIASYDYELDYGAGATPTSVAATAQTVMKIFGAVQNDANVGGISTTIEINNIQSSRYKRVLVTWGSRDGVPTQYVGKTSFLIADTAVLTGIKILFSAGNVNDGRVLVEGCA